MKTIEKLVVSITLLLLITSVNAQSVVISDIKSSVASPGCFSHGDRINVTFKFISRDKEGVRIFVRPFSIDRLTPNYAAAGSVLYPRGHGEGSGWFTITSGNVLVDHIRVEAVSKSGAVLYTQFKEVQYLFLKKTTSEEKPDSVSFAPVVIARNIMPNGDVVLSYSDMSRKRISKGVSVIINPDGSKKNGMVPYISVQPNTPPQLPEDSNVLNWLEVLNENLLSSIRTLVGDNETAVNHYLQNEKEVTDDLYKQIDWRIMYINYLLNEQK